MGIDWTAVGAKIAGGLAGMAVGAGVQALFSGLGGLFKRRRKRPKPVEPGYSSTTIIKGDVPDLQAMDLQKQILSYLQGTASTQANTQMRNLLMLQGTQQAIQAYPQIMQTVMQNKLGHAQLLAQKDAQAMQMGMERERLKLQAQQIAAQNRLAQQQAQMSFIAPLITAFINNSSGNSK